MGTKQGRQSLFIWGDKKFKNTFLGGREGAGNHYITETRTNIIFLFGGGG